MTTTKQAQKLDKAFLGRYKAVHRRIMAGANANLQCQIDNGQAWHLEGHYGRVAMDALEAGACVLPLEPITDYYGNTVPACWQLIDGSKGTVGNAEHYQANN